MPSSRSVAIWCNIALCFLAVASDLAAQGLKPQDMFGEEPQIPYAQGRVIIKLREARQDAPFTGYSERRARQDMLLGRLKAKYRLKGEEPVFTSLHGALSRRDLSVAEHLLELEDQSGQPLSAAPLEDLLPIYTLQTENGQDPSSLARELEQDPDVEFAQPDYVHKLSISPNDYYTNLSAPADPLWNPQLPYMWGAKRIKSAEANDASLGEGVIVALVDSGVDYTHPELRDNMWANPGEVPGDGLDNDGNGCTDDARGYDFVNNDNDPRDDQFHGTHMAGIISAVINNSIGIYGTAPRAKIMALKAADADGSIYSSRAASAIQYAVAKGAKIINNSYTSSAASDPVIEAAVRSAYQGGRVLVFAAGNDLADVAARSPQNMTEPIVVGNTTDLDKRDILSNFGATVDVSAPGSHILSTLNSTLTAVVYHHTLESKYFRTSGTSISAAYVSGAAALVASRNKNLSPAQIEQALKNGAVAITQEAGKPIGNRIDAFATLTSYVSAVDRAAITQAVFSNDQLAVSGILRAASPVSCQLSWKRSSSSTWTPLPSVAPATGQEFLAGTIAVGAIKEAVINLRLACGTLTHDLSVYLDRVADPAFFDKSGKRVSLLGNDIYSFKAARLAGLTWTQLQLHFQKVGDTAWQSDGVSLQVVPGPELVETTLFHFDSSVLPAAGEYRFRLTAAAAGGGIPYTITKEILVAADPSPVRGFPAYALGLVGEQQAAVADIDGDGDREICIDMPNWAGGGTPGLQVLHHDGTESATLSSRSFDFNSVGLTAADLDGSPGRELFAPTGDRLHAFSGVGVSLSDIPGWPIVRPKWWERWSGAPPPVSADLDFDGAPETVAIHMINFNQYFLSLHNRDGTKRFEITLPQVLYQVDSVNIVDLDNDFQKEILITTQASETEPPYLRAYRLTGAEYAGAGWPVNLQSISLRTGTLSEYSAVALATGDVDGDGDDEIVLTNQLHEVIALEKNAAVKGGFPRLLASAAGFPEAMIALGNIDAGPGAEMVVPNGDNLNVFTSAGTQPPGWPKTLSAVLPGYSSYSLDAPIIADINNDGSQEILAYASVANFYPYRPEAYLIAWNSGGAVVRQWKLYGGGYFRHNPAAAITDIDRDGTLEIVQVGRTQKPPSAGGGMAVGGGEDLSRVFVWKLSGSSTHSAMDWPMFKGNSRHTSQYIRYGDVSGDGEVSAFDASRAAQFAVGMLTFKSEQRERADVSGDGQVSAYDAALIARKAVGLLDRFIVDE